jgi:hypothetical protein
VENLSSAFSTEVAATATKQSENIFWATRIYIDESAILKLEHQKAIQKARIARAFVLRERSRAHAAKPDQPIASRQIRPAPSLDRFITQSRFSAVSFQSSVN